MDATNTTATLHYPLAGNYKGGRANLKAIRSHASVNGVDALCSDMKELCDMVETSPGALADLCPRCKAKLAKLGLTINLSTEAA